MTNQFTQVAFQSHQQQTDTPVSAAAVESTTTRMLKITGPTCRDYETAAKISQKSIEKVGNKAHPSMLTMAKKFALLVQAISQNSQATEAARAQSRKINLPTATGLRTQAGVKR